VYAGEVHKSTHDEDCDLDGALVVEHRGIPERTLARRAALEGARRMNVLRALTIFVLVAAAAQGAYYFPKLPDTVVSDFDAHGAARGSSSKESFIRLFAGATVLLAAIFLGLPRVIDKLPVGMINIPNKSYWMAAGRRREAFARLERELLVFGAGTLLFFLGMGQIIIQANLSGERRAFMPACWGLLGVYLVFTLFWATRMMSAFAKTE
jgi:uncharacterized membrane protein